MIKYVYFIVLLFCMPLVHSQMANDSLQVLTDTDSELVTRDWNEDLNKKYSGEEFNYDIKTGESQNLLARFLNWIGRGLKDIFGINISPEAFKIIQYLIYALMGGLVIYLLVKLLVNEKFNSIFTKKATAIADIDLSEQHIESLDIEALLQKALKANDYRLAIRYHYLKVLKKLSKAELITWHFDKTNIDYQNELERPKLKLNFKKVSYLYDYIWYGEQFIDENSYQKALQSFNLLNNNLPQ